MAKFDQWFIQASNHPPKQNEFALFLKRVVEVLEWDFTNDVFYLGVDPSLTASGVVLYNQTKNQFSGFLIKTNVDNYRQEHGRISRIIDIKEVVQSVVTIFRPVKTFMESVAMGARKSTSLDVLAGLNFLIQELLYSNNLEFRMYTPTELKKAFSGKGNSNKEKMNEALGLYNFNIDPFLFSNKKGIIDDNIVDAIALISSGIELGGSSGAGRGGTSRVPKT